MNPSAHTESGAKAARFKGVLLRVLLSSLLLVGLAVAPSSQTSGSISLSPDKVEIGSTAELTLTASGFFDLSEVKLSQIGIRPNGDISNLKIVSATAQRMKLSFKLSEGAAEGTRTLLIKDRKGSTVVALDLIVKLPRHVCRPPCTGFTRCKDNRCEHDGTICVPGCGDCKRCVANSCRKLVCNPPCDSPVFSCECGSCVRQK